MSSIMGIATINPSKVSSRLFRFYISVDLEFRLKVELEFEFGFEFSLFW
jgi:hypothetical protein